MLKCTLLILVLTVLSGCGEEGNGLDGEDPDGNGLSGDWVRVGYPDCEGTLPLQELPVEHRFIYNNRLTVEQNGDRLTFSIEGRSVMSATLHGTDILTGTCYSAAIDADPPLRYSQITVCRAGYVLDDGARLEFRDDYESRGDFLVCRHEFEPA